MKILIATSNPHKFEELVAILPQKLKNGKPIEYVSLAEFKGLSLPPETGLTLAENAELKAAYAARETGLPAISDDTGLEVDALNGRPGIRTGRYAGSYASVEDNNRKLLGELEGVEPARRKAVFRTVACLVMPEGRVMLFEGSLAGAIGSGYRGGNGFGYDPLFVVDGRGKTLAELPAEEKNKISHRAQAFKQLADYLVSSVRER